MDETKIDNIIGAMLDRLNVRDNGDFGILEYLKVKTLKELQFISMRNIPLIGAENYVEILRALADALELSEKE